MRLGIPEPKAVGLNRRYDAGQTTGLLVFLRSRFLFPGSPSIAPNMKSCMLSVLSVDR